MQNEPEEGTGMLGIESKHANVRLDRYGDALASVDGGTTLEQLSRSLQRRGRWKGQLVRECERGTEAYVRYGESS